MPVIKQYAENLKKFYMPSTAFVRDAAGEIVKDAEGKAQATPVEDQAFVVLDVSPTITNDILNPDLSDLDNTNLRLAKLLLARIREWNYTFESGEQLPITLDSLKLLQREDFQYLCQQPFATPGKTLGDDQKKS